jgi:acetyl-CoA carboxylase biotin carboxyl carrier protein
MDAVDKVRQLIEIMRENDLTELEMEQPELRVRIRKSDPPAQNYFAAPMNFAGVPQPGAAAPALAPGGEDSDSESDQNEGLVEITSPMVGTFYRSPSVGSESYVNKGEEVDVESVVCIIEAMKVMNEIKAEVEGRVVEVLVQDGEPVEFGQVLFLVEPIE